jgi:hypothetical protein
MAGAGAKLFTSGSVLTADQVNTYLMDQSIMRFATTTARDAAFGGAGEPTLAEGMFAYTSDTDTLWFYTGSAWEVATIKPSVVDAKGDLLAGTAADTLARLAVGTNGHLLSAASGETTGLKWVLPKVVQIVFAGTTLGQFTSSTTYTDVSGVTATITPKSASSQILVLCCLNGGSKEAGSASNGLNTRVIRGASTLVTQMSTGAGYNNVNGLVLLPSIVAVELNSPATTSAVTYKAQFASDSAGYACYLGRGGEASTLFLMEISA